MITGQVNSFRLAMITIGVSGTNGNTHELPAMLDTGFTGNCSLPPSIIKQLGLAFVEQRVYTLATGEDAT